jgi:hypothetical protein
MYSMPVQRPVTLLARGSRVLALIQRSRHGTSGHRLDGQVSLWSCNFDLEACIVSRMQTDIRLTLTHAHSLRLDWLSSAEKIPR